MPVLSTDHSSVFTYREQETTSRTHLKIIHKVSDSEGTSHKQGSEHSMFHEGHLNG
jgi:TnpA family transposase